MTPLRAAIVGAGISGLAAAYRLRKELGPEALIRVYDAAPAPGGKLRTERILGFSVDVGAEAFVQRRTEVLQLAEELGLTAELVTPGPHRPVIWSAGAVHTLPPGTFMGIPGSAESVEAMRGMVSAPALQFAVSEPERPLRWDPGTDVSLADLVAERFGAEVVRKSVDPLISGVYAGDARTVGVRAAIPELARALDAGASSLTAAVRGMLSPQGAGPVFATFRNGYATLLRALLDASRADVQAATPVTAVSRSGSGWDVATAGTAERADLVILAVPAHRLAHLLRTSAPQAAAAAREIRHASSALVTFGFGDDVQLPEWSGILVAGDENLHAKAVTLTSRKWPHHAGRGLLRVSLGRFGDNPPVTEESDAVLTRRASTDLQLMTGITAQPRAVVVQRWPESLPQYETGHQCRVQTIEHGVAELPGIGVAGGYLHGVGVPACIASASSAVTKAIADVAG